MNRDYSACVPSTSVVEPSRIPENPNYLSKELCPSIILARAIRSLSWSAHNAKRRNLCGIWCSIFVLSSLISAKAQSFKKVHLGFPEAWDGDKYQELHCPSRNIPKFLGIPPTIHLF